MHAYVLAPVFNCTHVCIFALHFTVNIPLLTVPRFALPNPPLFIMLTVIHLFAAEQREFLLGTTSQHPELGCVVI